MKVRSDADFLDYNVDMHTVTGSVRVLAKAFLNVQGLLKWSIEALALLHFLQMGAAAQIGLARTVLWCECVDALGAEARVAPFVAKVRQLMGYTHDRHAGPGRGIGRGPNEFSDPSTHMIATPWQKACRCQGIVREASAACKL